MILSELRARAWQAGTIGATAGAAILAILLTLAVLQRDAMTRERDALHAEIHSPVTGYIARLSLCRGNERRLDRALTTQNDAIAELRRDGQARIAATEQRLAAAQHAAAEARVRADRLLDTPLTAIDRCARIEEADNLALEALR